MQKSIVSALAALCAVAAARPAAAQTLPTTPLSVEVRGGAAFPMGDFADERQGNAETGWGYGGNVSLQLNPALALYAGYDRFEFPSDNFEVDLPGNVGDVDGKWIDSGFSGGVKLMLPLATMSRLGPWVKGGVVYRKLGVNLDDERFDELEDELETDPALGFEVGGGLSLPLGPRVAVTPGVRYLSYSADPVDGGDGEVNVSHLTLDLGLSIRF